MQALCFRCWGYLLCCVIIAVFEKTISRFRFQGLGFSFSILRRTAVHRGNLNGFWSSTEAEHNNTEVADEVSPTRRARDDCEGGSTEEGWMVDCGNHNTNRNLKRHKHYQTFSFYLFPYTIRNGWRARPILSSSWCQSITRGSPLTPQDKETISKSWKLISSGQSMLFLKIKAENPDIEAKSSMEFFGDLFSKRFIEVHPTSRPMFSKSTMKQGTLFFRMRCPKYFA